MPSMKVWKESASLIVVAQNNSKQDQSYDYDVLLLKRQESAYWGGSYVFPGGIFELADADLKWHNLFENYGYDEKDFESLYPSTLKRPKIFHKKENELPREVSLRICAIRETFEECGILLCKRASKSNQISDEPNHMTLSERELDLWQNKVHNDADEFFNMCKELKCYPNLWDLYEWGNWMTPPFLQLPKRFNVAFFITSLSTIPKLQIEYCEIEDSVWATPKYILDTLKTSLLAPQKYEISRISNYSNVENLMNYALEKSKLGTKLSVYVKVNLLDGMVFLLPGDSMYPEEVDIDNEDGIDRRSITVKQFRGMSAKTHRIEFFHDPENQDRLRSKL